MYLYEDAAFLDEKVITNETVNGYPEYYRAVDHAYTINQPETFNMSAQFRELMDTYSEKYGETRYVKLFGNL